MKFVFTRHGIPSEYFPKPASHVLLDEAWALPDWLAANRPEYDVFRFGASWPWYRLRAMITKRLQESVQNHRMLIMFGGGGGNQEHCRFLGEDGAITRKRLFDLMRLCKMCVTTGAAYEYQVLKYVEAAACGCVSIGNFEEFDPPYPFGPQASCEFPRSPLKQSSLQELVNLAVDDALKNKDSRHHRNIASNNFFLATTEHSMTKQVHLNVLSMCGFPVGYAQVVALWMKSPDRFELVEPSARSAQHRHQHIKSKIPATIGDV